jgi:hypothetical protein
VIPNESEPVVNLPSFEARSLMKSLNRHYGKLKGLAMTETPQITMEQHQSLDTELNLGSMTYSIEN